MQDIQFIKPKNQMVVELQSRVLTLKNNGQWFQKIDLPDGNISIELDGNVIFNE